MFDGEEIPQRKIEEKQSEEQTGEVDQNEYTFPSQDGVETIALQVLATTSQTEDARTFVCDNTELPGTAIETTEALQVFQRLWLEFL